jgi:Protein of unknown function (DUF1573)
MKSRTIFVVLGLLTLFALTASAQESSTGAPRMATASLEHSFGSVTPGTPLKYTFQIKNEGKTVLEIKNVAPSCGCTTSDYDKTIAPGKSGGITLEVAKTDGYSGDVTKTATVTTNDPDHQSFVLTLKAFFKAN